jgi:OmpA family/Membrane MotB of proton-channel complex MotA/MotB
MFDSPTVLKRRSKDEAEKPFWISFADLMTAMMILFLVVMSVALLAVTRKISDTERGELDRAQEIKKLLDMMAENVKNCGQATVLPERYIIDFGPQAEFDFGSNKLSPLQQRYLRECVPDILAVTDSDLGKKWIKRIVVEGYTDQVGGYLYNLNLSLQRSQRVLCALLGKGNAGERTLTLEERKQIRDIFLVGGYSFNSAKDSPEQSRRVELRLEFWGLADPREAKSEDVVGADNDTSCPLDLKPISLPNPVPPTTQSPPSPLQKLLGH